MNSCVDQALKKFDHPAPSSVQRAPHQWIQLVRGSRKPQNPTDESSATPFDKVGRTICWVQWINGTFMCCGRSVEPCILISLKDIATEQAAPTADAISKTDTLVDCPRMHPNAVIRHHASNTILKSSTDAACSVLPKAQSHAALHCHLGWEDSDRANGAGRNVLCKIIKSAASSAAEAKTAGVCMGGKHACPMITALEELGHPQTLSTGSPLVQPTTARPTVSSTPKCTKSTPIFQRVLLVHQRPNQPRPIQSPLGTRHAKPRRLLHKAPPTLAPPSNGMQTHSQGEQRFKSPANSQHARVR
jgi:hypothetical protein